MSRLFAAAALLLGSALAQGVEPPPPAPAAAPGERLSRIQGTVARDRNERIAGVTVTARPAANPGRVFLTSTDERGQFWVDGLEDGDYRVEFERDGYASLVKHPVTLRFPFRAVVEVLLVPSPAAATTAADGVVAAEAGPAHVSGRVRERGGAPVQEASIELLRPDGSADPLVAISDADGTFSLEAPRGGRWRLEARGVGYLPLDTTVDVRGELSLELLLVIQPPRYRPSPRELMPQEQPLPPAGWERP